jgi:intracellular multiplication protein IcmL
MAETNQNQDQGAQGIGSEPVASPQGETPKTIPDNVFGDTGEQTPPPSQAPDTAPAAPAVQAQTEPTPQAVTPNQPTAEPEKKKFKFKSGGVGSKPAKQTKPAAKPAKGNANTKQNNVPRGALNAVVTRNEYYRDGYRNIMKVAMIEGVIIAVLCAMFIVYMNIHKGQDRFFATTADGRILQLVPLDQPNMATSALMSWVSQAATEVMTFGFHDYQRRLQDASRHFTRRGWESFTTALQRSRIIESVDSLQQVVTAAPRSAPVLVQQGVFNGRYRWVVRLPLTVTFRSGSKQSSSNLEVTITIERVPTLESPNGVGIESWIAR